MLFPVSKFATKLLYVQHTLCKVSGVYYNDHMVAGTGTGGEREAIAIIDISISEHDVYKAQRTPVLSKQLQWHWEVGG